MVSVTSINEDKDIEADDLVEEIRLGVEQRLGTPVRRASGPVRESPDPGNWGDTNLTEGMSLKPVSFSDVYQLFEDMGEIEKLTEVKKWARKKELRIEFFVGEYIYDYVWENKDSVKRQGSTKKRVGLLSRKPILPRAKSAL